MCDESCVLKYLTDEDTKLKLKLSSNNRTSSVGLNSGLDLRQITALEFSDLAAGFEELDSRQGVNALFSGNILEFLGVNFRKLH